MADLGEAYIAASVPPDLFLGAGFTRAPIPPRDLGAVAHVIDPAGLSGAKTGQLWPRR